MSNATHILQQAIRLVILLGLFVAPSFAAEETTANLPVMPQVKVEATRIASTTGVFLIDKELLEKLPSRNGNVNEVIGILPGAQYGETAIGSFTNGEITPPHVSVSGSRYYDNNYTIDGISNNNPIDPIQNEISTSENAPADASKLPMFPQNQFLSTRLIEQVKIYNSNIPAEFGDFSGGQIDSKTINPSDEFWGEVNYRTTRDNWTKFYISPADEDDFYNSDRIYFQPKFKKQDLGATLNIPLNFESGLLISYQQLSSDIPLNFLDGQKTQSRKQESYFAKINHEISNKSRFSLTAIFSPTTNKYFIREYLNSDYRINSKSFTLITNYDTSFNLGTLEFAFSYTGNESNRQGEANRFWWNSSTPSIDWSTGKEGSLGDLKIGYNELSIKPTFSFKILSIGSTEHQLKTGSEVTYTRQYYDRPDDNYYYTGAVTGAINCIPGAPACIDGEQYLSRRTKYFAADKDIETWDLAAFLQDSITWKRLELFPGVRASHDNITHDLNIAPRFSASVDLFADQNTVLFTGANRYYSGTRLTFELYEAIRYETQTRAAADNNWTSKPVAVRRGSDLNTPYSDELTVGILQRLLGGELKLQYIHKTGKDEFARTRTVEFDENGKSFSVYTLNNNGRSEHQSYLVSWQRSWRNHFLELNCTWQETTTSHTDYDTTFDDDDVFETVWHDGVEIYKHERPRTNFNRPVVANLVYTGDFPYGISFTNIAKFRGPYSYYKFTGIEPSVINPGENAFAYEKARHHSSLLFDWKISWKIPTFSNQEAIATIEIYNIFNRKTNYGSGSDNYELGRQYWAGLTYKF